MARKTQFVQSQRGLNITVTSKSTFVQEESSPLVPQDITPQTQTVSMLNRFKAKLAQVEQSNIFWILVSAVLLLAGISRLLFLADKPFHHDESLHGYYSDRVAQGFVHEYSALLHGPFLYYFVGAFLFLFGTGDFSARFPAALFGILLVA